MERPPAIVAARTALDQNRAEHPAGPLRRLITRIITDHHEYLKRELPAIEVIIAEGVHADSGIFRQTAAALFPLFLRFRRELEGHMIREESTLFPLIERLECAVTAGQPVPRNSFGPLSNAIQFMNEDHDFENKLLAMMAEISHGFASPPDAHARYRALMTRLQAVKVDVDEHVRKEDELLFPQAICLEQSGCRTD